MKLERLIKHREKREEMEMERILGELRELKVLLRGVKHRSRKARLKEVRHRWRKARSRGARMEILSRHRL